jgi:glycosyltransferase involved in cell wall biosynthesis/GT2 family glycosyltransferase
MATYDGAATLPRVLDAYCRLLPPAQPWRLLVVDNGSTDGTAAILAQHASRLPLHILHQPQRGKNRALNLALDHVLPAAAPDDLFVFTDDDAMPAADWLQQWEVVAAAQPDYPVFGGAIVADWAVPPPGWLLRLVPLGLTYGLTAASLPAGPVFPGLVWGANMALRGLVLRSGQRFDPSVGPGDGDYAMGSETEFVRRVALAGFHSWHSPAPQVAHHIRAQQLTLAYVLQKARRYGRGQFRQDRPGMFPELAGAPRWMWRRYLSTPGRWLLARLRGEADATFGARWDSAYLYGYLREAWRGRRPQSPNIVITSYSGELGGMELRMAQEVRFLQRAGYAAMLALRPFAGLAAWSQQLATEQVPVAAFEPPTFFEQWAGRRRQLWRAHWLAPARLRAFRADLVHVAFCWTHYGASALWLAARCQLPTVVSVHNAFPHADVDRWHQPLLRQAFAGVRGVYAVSETAMAHFLAMYQPYLPTGAKLAVIPNPVDVARFRPDADARYATRARWGIPQDALVIGSVARLSPQKQPATVLALFGMLRKQFPNLYLVLAGRGPLEQRLRMQADRMGLTSHLVFTGFVDDIAALMPALDLHVLLSRNEGFGIATAEAMACGVAVVATDVPGNADILRDSAAGMLVAPGNIKPSVPAIAALLADPDRRAAMGLQGRAQAQARYSIDVVGQLVRDFYADLV